MSIDDDAARELGLAKHVELTILDTSTNMDALVAALATVLGADVPRVTFGNPD